MRFVPAIALAALGALVPCLPSLAQNGPSATGSYRYWHQMMDVVFATNSVCEATGTIEITQSGRILRAKVQGQEHCTARAGYPEVGRPHTMAYTGRIDPRSGEFVLRSDEGFCRLEGGLSPQRAWAEGDMVCAFSRGTFKLTHGPGAVTAGTAPPAHGATPPVEGLYQDDYVDGTKPGGYVEQQPPPTSAPTPPGPTGPPRPIPRPATAPAPRAPTPASGAYGGTAGGVVAAPSTRPARFYPTQLFVTIKGATPAGRRVRNACADINIGGLTARVLGDVTYYTPNPSSAGFFEIQATMTRPDMWLPGEYPVNVTAATSCARDGEYLVFDPLQTAIRVEYPSSGGLVGRSFEFRVLAR